MATRPYSHTSGCLKEPLGTCGTDRGRIDGVGGMGRV